MLVTGTITLHFSLLTGLICCGLQLLKLSQDNVMSVAGSRQLSVTPK